LATFQGEEITPPQEEGAASQQGEEETDMGSPLGKAMNLEDELELETPGFSLSRAVVQDQGEGSRIPRSAKSKSKARDSPRKEEEEELDYGDDEDHEEEAEAVSEEKRNPRGRKETPRPQKGGERRKAPTPQVVPEPTFNVTPSQLEYLVTKKVEVILTSRGTSRDNEKGARPKVPALRKWSDTEAKRPIRKFLEEVEVWFDATDIRGARRVTILPKLLDDTAHEWLLAEKAKYPEGLDSAKTWEEMKEMMVARFVPKHQHFLDGIALVKVH
jgi:hypothetical protein